MDDTQVKNNARGYHGHRGRQRERILRVAETLFLRDGIESVGINDIAVAANVTRATIYRYFANRVEIIWALLRYYGESLIHTMPAEVMNLNLSGATRLRFVLQGFMNHFFRYPEQSLFAIQFDQLYSNKNDIEKMSQFKKELVQHEFPLSRLIEAGVRDGSLRPNLDPIITSTTILAIIWGISRHFAQLYATYEYTNKFTMRETYQDICDVMLQGLIAEK
jgi:AcrR family transcriptional regulator